MKHILDLLLVAAPVVLLAAFVRARLIERRYRPGVRVGKAGIRHTDIWRDD